MKIEKIILGIVLVTLAAGAVIVATAPKDSTVSNVPASQLLSTEKKATLFGKYHEIEKPAGFVNTGDTPITIGEFIGKKVVLIDFVTYSCINCQRTFPYLRSWYEKYHAKGLEIIAIHTPEFAFEHDKKNVEKAFKEFGLAFPAVLDNDYATWNAYGNQYWPRKYLIDIDGYVVYDHAGEGNYDQTEQKIVELLNERAGRLKEPPIADSSGKLPSSAPVSDIENAVLSPETYLGSLRADKLSGTALQCQNSGVCSYGTPIQVPNDKFSLSGKWKQANEYMQLEDSKGSLFYRFTAGKVHLVADADTATTAEVFIDGKPIPAGLSGGDVKDGKVVFLASRLYTLVDTKSAPQTHLLELRFNQSGFRGYAFTFGL